MATSAPNQPPPGSSSVPVPQPQPGPPNSDQITWDGDKMFNIYILDYCKKRGYHKTASQLVTEADIPPESKPPINAQQGLLFEWWSVFWVLFQAKNSGNGSEDAMLYHKHQNQLKMRTAQVPPPGVGQPPGRYLPNGVAGSVPLMPNTHINGLTSAGPPPSLSGPPYGPANPSTQPNTMPGPPTTPGHPGQPFPGAMAGRPLGPQQRLPNGGPPYQSPTIAPSPQSQGNPQQPSAGPMGQLGRSPHMSTINRAAMPPPNGPQPPQGPGPAGSAHPTPTMSYQTLGRPSSSLDTSSQNPMNPHRSPAMGGRASQTQDRSHMDATHHSVDTELASYPPELIGEAKYRANLGDREAQSLTVDEKKNIIAHAAQLKQNSQQSSGVSGPAGANVQGQLQNRGPMAQPMQQQLSMQQQRGGKRSSTSPGEEHRTLPRNEQSPPDRKRQRKATPSPAEQQRPQSQPQQPQQQQQQSQPQPPPQQQPQQVPQQQQQHPPMAPIGSLPSGLPQMSGAGSVRGMPMPGGHAPPGGFGGPPMHPIGMTPGHMNPMHGMTPGMGHAPMGVMNPQQMNPLYAQTQFRPGPGPGMVNVQKGGPPGGPGDPQTQAHMRGGPGAMPNRPPQPGQQLKPMGPGPMLPPGQQGMNGPPKPGVKDEADVNTPLAASTPTPLLNTAQQMNPQRPPTTTAQLSAPPPTAGPGPMPDLSFDMGDMFGNGGGDFDFGPDSLGDMHLWFDPTAVQDGASIDMK